MKLALLPAAAMLVLSSWPAAHAAWWAAGGDNELLYLDNGTQGWYFAFDCTQGLSGGYYSGSDTVHFWSTATLNIVGDGGWHASFPVKPDTEDGNDPGFVFTDKEGARLLALVRDGVPFVAYVQRGTSIQGKQQFDQPAAQYEEITKDQVLSFCPEPKS